MKRSKYLIVISLLAVMVLLLSACGKKKPTSTPDEAIPAETTVVLETTSDGGTIEQDSEGNRITKDEKGNILSVEDKDGKPVDVERYITTHSWVVNSDTAGSSGGSEKSGGSAGSGSPGGSDGKGASGNGSGSSSADVSSDRNDTVEETVPVIVATFPDDKDLEKVPDL